MEKRRNKGMKEEMRRLGERGAQGAVMGVFLVFTLGMVMGGLRGQGDVSYAFLTRQYAAGFVIGAVFNGMNLLFEKGTLGLAQATLVHFLVTFMAFVPMGLYAGWMASEHLLMALAIFILIYVGIWLASYLLWKKEVERINSQLKSRP